MIPNKGFVLLDKLESSGFIQLVKLGARHLDGRATFLVVDKTLEVERVIHVDLRPPLFNDGFVLDKKIKDGELLPV